VAALDEHRIASKRHSVPGCHARWGSGASRPPVSQWRVAARSIHQRSDPVNPRTASQRNARGQPNSLQIRSHVSKLGERRFRDPGVFLRVVWQQPTIPLA
jgi:hypothetical protein